MATPSTSELLLRWQELRDQGQEVTPEKLCAGHPELIAELRRQIQTLASMEHLLQSDNGREREVANNKQDNPVLAHNLLLGILAYQNAFITREAFFAGMQVLLYDKAKSLADILQNQVGLDTDRRKLLEALVGQHLKQHGDDPRKSLQALSSVSSIRNDLQQMPDPALQASITYLSTGGTDNESPTSATTLAILSNRAEPAPASLTHVEGLERRTEPAEVSNGELGETTHLASLNDGGTLTFSEKPAFTGHAKSQPNIPGCEILGELGRGGMGVVYWVWQSSLNRTAALKMLLAGVHAGSDALARFQTETLAIARLQHGNIVQVFEVGTHDGLPYLIQEYVEGGSLAGKVAKGPFFPRLAALLVEALARAVQHAHQRGVIHRDLKPSNILLTADGVPKITDFGLAKILLGGDQSLTHTGSIMGTPSYMAPEQAAGKTREIGPGTDIYALGAILYATLTAHPPFQGTTVLETLDQVQLLEPVAPRRLQGKVPRDLETICLKCLQKNPRQRYLSAAALADDLQRFLTAEPIHARPTPLWERGMKWAKRRPALAALLHVSVAAVLTVLSLSLWYSAKLRDALAQKNEEYIRAENNHRLLAEQEAQEQGRLAEVRLKAQELLLKAQQAADRKDWEAAKADAGTILAQVAPEPVLVDLRAPAKRLQAQAERQLEVQAERKQARGRYQLFQRRRDDTLFHGTFVTGIDRADDLEETRKAAREALELFGITEAAESGPLSDPGPFFNEREKHEIREACYELLLILADAVAEPLPPYGVGDRRAAARSGLAVLDRAAQVSPPTKAYHLRRARFLGQGGDKQAGDRERQTADAAQAKTASDYFLVGDELYKQGQLPGAVAAFEDALRLQPGHFWSQYFLGVCHLMLKRPGEAQAFLSACLSQRSDFEWVYLVRGVAEGRLKHFTAAEADFRKALELQQSTSARYGVLVNRGAMRLEQGKVDEAIADLLAAVALFPRQHQAHYNLAEGYLQQKQPLKALEHLNEAIHLAPTLAHPYRLRAQLHRDRQEPASALADLAEAIRREPAGSTPLALDHLERGRILHEQKKFPEALAAYDAALKLQPDNTLANRLRADALLALGRGPEALEAFDHYLGREQKDADAYRQRGYERQHLGNQPGAIADYTRALEIEPHSPFTRARRGWALIDSRDAARQALRDFEEAIRLEPRNGEYYNGRGYARTLLGQYRDGVADAEEALKRGAQGKEMREQVALTYNAACVFAQASGQAAVDDPAADPAALAKRYESRSVELLRAALDLMVVADRAAFVRQACDDIAFSFVRRRALFQEVVKEYSSLPP